MNIQKLLINSETNALIIITVGFLKITEDRFPKTTLASGLSYYDLRSMMLMAKLNPEE